ncbi:unnamed protein product [Phytophthora lilii]|uniref:Cyclin-dependent kinase 2 homolog n=1 Tax=Phytophthora lilii TaxID=2077276 RepID=A0A9W6YJU6_9STRA|nr:unnamed protein product [Phytophthora lilii]
MVLLVDLGLARIYKEPIKALSDVERVVVTLWYRAPELLLGAKHYTKAVDLWAVGCIFAELINTRELFCGKEVEGSNAPFQKDQLDKIFKVLGMPTPQTWEGLENLPEYNHVVQMGRERKYPTQSELKSAVKVGPGRAGAALLDLLSRLLEYEPVAEESLPWKSKKDGATGADGKPSEAGVGSPHRDGSSSRSSQHHNDHRGRDAPSRSRSHHNSRDPQQQPQRRSDRNAGDASSSRDTRSRAPAGGNAQSAGGSAWRDRSTGRAGGAAAPSTGAVTGAKRPGGSERPTSASSSGRPRSPKQPRRR